MPKVLQMPKREYRDDQKNTSRLPELIASDKEEQSATTGKIEGWLRLADLALADGRNAKKA